MEKVENGWCGMIVLLRDQADGSVVGSKKLNAGGWVLVVELMK